MEGANEIKKRKNPEFQRTKFRAYVKLGSGQKSMRKYKKAKGRHNKIRQKEKGRPRKVEIGFKNDARIRGLVLGKTPVFVQRLQDIEKVGKGNLAIIGNIGRKAKIEIAKEIQKRNISVLNLNVRKFLRKMERMQKHKEKEKAGAKQKEATPNKKEQTS